MEATVTIQGDQVSLEGRLAVPAKPAGGMVLCHPHPLYGGDLDNPVVVRAAEVCREAGLATLRFNFRGVGGSSGPHDEGRGEQSDVRSALDHLAEALPAAVPLAVLGYSFGAWVGGRAGRSDGRVAGLAIVAPPLELYDFGFLAGWKGHLLLAAGSRDPYCPRLALNTLAGSLPGARVTVIEGADHFFFGKLYPLGEAIRAWARGLSEARPGQSHGDGGAR